MAVSTEHASHIAGALGLDAHELKVSRVGGGDIAESCVLQTPGFWVFVKTLPLHQASLLSAEADGLQALKSTGTVRVPGVIKRGVIDDQLAWLALEHLNLDQRSERADQTLGSRLAALHRTTSDKFGWHRNNYIGATPQKNPPTLRWTEFFLEHRLGAQFDRLASHHPEDGWPDLKQVVFEAWTERFSDHQPEPALIHGDLWKGNAAAIGKSEAVVFDPAVHYADRECDLAMTHLFGGFSNAFYEAYEKAWPLPPFHEQRRLFYKLYHLLNHANLFGGAYLEAAGKLCYRILADD